METRDAAQHPIVHRTLPPPEAHGAPIVSSVEGAKPWLSMKDAVWLALYPATIIPIYPSIHLFIYLIYL